MPLSNSVWWRDFLRYCSLKWIQNLNRDRKCSWNFSPVPQKITRYSHVWGRKFKFDITNVLRLRSRSVFEFLTGNLFLFYGTLQQFTKRITILYTNGRETAIFLGGYYLTIHIYKYICIYRMTVNFYGGLELSAACHKLSTSRSEDKTAFRYLFKSLEIVNSIFWKVNAQSFDTENTLCFRVSQETPTLVCLTRSAIDSEQTHCSYTLFFVHFSKGPFRRFSLAPDF